ncbi:MAG: hypothetical protein U0838_14945 [Chloroflexota bacterium]
MRLIIAGAPPGAVASEIGVAWPPPEAARADIRTGHPRFDI